MEYLISFFSSRSIFICKLADNHYHVSDVQLMADTFSILYSENHLRTRLNNPLNKDVCSLLHKSYGRSNEAHSICRFDKDVLTIGCLNYDKYQSLENETCRVHIPMQI